MKMINVAEARELIYQQCTSIKMIRIPLAEAHGLVLAADIISTVDTPPFHQSAMDGYAFSFADWDGLSSLKIAGELPAGKFSATALPVSSAIRIFTGAPVPAGADTVVIQEKVKVEGGLLFRQAA